MRDHIAARRRREARSQSLQGSFHASAYDWLNQRPFKMRPRQRGGSGSILRVPVVRIGRPHHVGVRGMRLDFGDAVGIGRNSLQMCSDGCLTRSHRRCQVGRVDLAPRLAVNCDCVPNLLRVEPLAEPVGGRSCCLTGDWWPVRWVPRRRGAVQRGDVGSGLSTGPLCYEHGWHEVEQRHIPQVTCLSAMITLRRSRASCLGRAHRLRCRSGFGPPLPT